MGHQEIIMQKQLLLILVSTFSFSVWAKIDIGKESLKYVPNGKIEVKENDEVKVKTAQDTFIEIEFNRDGSLDEASGDLALKDDFTPGNNLLTLKEAVSALEKSGKTVSGEWSLDKGFLKDWEYEFEGVEEGKKFEYVVNAKTGKLIESKPD